MASQAELADRFSALLQQESATWYKCNEYLSFQDGDSNHSIVTHVDESWREKICEWVYNVVDHFNCNREIVSIAVNYFDRYLSNCNSGSVANSKLLQLIAVSALHIALKIHDSNAVHLPTLLELSCNFFTAQHVVVMEKSMLQLLSWRLSPPTPLTFLHHFMLLMPKEEETNSLEREIIGESAQFLVELSVCDYYFITRKPSSIALASLLNACEQVLGSTSSSNAMIILLRRVQTIAGVGYCSQVKECQHRLQEIYDMGEYAEQRSISPVSVVPPPTSHDTLEQTYFL